MADFHAFFAFLGFKPSKEHSLDRINNGGGYVPGNVRWATKREQSINKRPKGKTSKWRGVYFNKHHGKYMVRANEIYVGVFESEIDAAAAYNRCVLKNNLRNKLNFIVEVV